MPSHFPKWRGTCPLVPNGAGASDCQLNSSVNLYVDIDVADKPQRREERYGTKHQRECIASEYHVSKELGCLQRTRHVRTFDVVEHGVQQHKHAC